MSALSSRRVLLLAAALSLWWPASALWQLLLIRQPGLGVLLVGAAVLAVAALLRASLSLPRHRFGLVWTLGVPVLLAGPLSLVLTVPVAGPALIGLWLLVGLWVYHRWWPMGLQLEPPGLQRRASPAIGTCWG